MIYCFKDLMYLSDINDRRTTFKHFFILARTRVIRPMMLWWTSCLTNIWIQQFIWQTIVRIGKNVNYQTTYENSLGLMSMIARVMGPTWAHLGPVGPRWTLCSGLMSFAFWGVISSMWNACIPCVLLVNISELHCSINSPADIICDRVVSILMRLHWFMLQESPPFYVRPRVS